MNPVFYAIAYATWFLSTFYVVFFLIVLFENKDNLFERRKMPRGIYPSVSIIVPAYNEEEGIASTIASLKKIRYSEVEFIIVNDGSRDKTSAVVRAEIGRDKRFTFIDRAKNKGKAASLNEGMRAARGEYIACMDADSRIEPAMLEKMLPYIISDPKVGAVTCSVAIEKPKNLLHHLIAVEYIVGLSLFLKLLSKINAVFVTPGPFSLYRKSTLTTIGGFDEKSIVEDYEVAFRIHAKGFRIQNCLEATVRTICPPTFNGLLAQRRRWYSGSLQTIAKHHRMLLTTRYGYLGLLIPFNFLLVGTGLVVYLTTIWLTVKNLYADVASYQYTGFNLWDRLLDTNFDLLRFRQVSMIGVTAGLLGLLLLFLSISLSRQSFRKHKRGIILYPVLFTLYQIWWFVSFWAFARRKKISWR